MVDDMFALAHILGWVKHKGGNIPKTQHRTMISPCHTPPYFESGPP